MIHIAYEPYNLKSAAACKESGQIVSQRVACNIMLYGGTFHPIDLDDLCPNCMTILERIMGERLAMMTSEWGKDTDEESEARADYADPLN